MKRWSKGYEALRTYVRFAFWLTHKRIVVVGRELIPKDVPVIFAANHQNALMDPLAISCTNPLQTLWLARADIFKSKLARPALKFMKMVPIYRIRDGKENLTNNELIFDQVTEVLENKDSVALFPEAAHSGKRQMLQHKKAIPRIALEAEDKNNFQLGLQIVPVGIYYDHYWRFNRTLVVEYGQPIGIGGYQRRYAENPQNAMITLRDEIHEKLEPLTLQINSKELYKDYEDIRMVSGEEYSHYKFFSKNATLQQLWADKELIAKIEKMEVDQFESFDQLRRKTIAYVEGLKAAGFKNHQLVKANHTSFAKLLLQFGFAILTLPLLVFGILFNFIPYYFPRVVLTRKVKDPAFLSTFIFVSGLVLFPLFYILECVLTGLLSGLPWLGFGILFFLPFAGKAAFNLLEFDYNLIQVIRLKSFFRVTFQKLNKLRSNILEFVVKNLAH
ncbi:MAG: 1-acyl-sn-glycerol-3-phosphate acyltransferase [Prolixibacteraceae bacterium]